MSKKKNITTPREELAWAAGFFDGEGHVRGKGGTITKSEMQVGQKTVGCLERLQRALGNIGYIGGPYHKEYPVYFWYLTKTSDVDKALTALWPFLSEPKRNQAIKAGFKLGFIRNPKVGRPPRKKEDLKVPFCHPDRKHVGNGLCGSCYQMEWRRKNGR